MKSIRYVYNGIVLRLFHYETDIDGIKGVEEARKVHDIGWVYRVKNDWYDANGKIPFKFSDFN